MMSESTRNKSAFYLRHYPDPALSKRCALVEDFGPSLAELAHAMIASMREHEGVGLAANQMGQCERLFVMAAELVGDADLTLVNPVILEKEASCALEEGCLSLPGIRYLVDGRAQRVVMGYQNLAGEPCRSEFTGLAALCAQHELDHLDGLTMIDRLSPLKAARVKAKLIKAQRANRG